MLPYIAEKKTKAWWMDGWIDSWWAWIGCCWQDGNSFEYWKGGQQNKRLGLFLQMSFDAALDGLLGGGCTAINERFMHSGGRRVIPPPSPAGASSQRTWKKEEKGGRSVSFSFAKKEPGKASATTFACDTIQCSSSTTAQARPELNCRPQSSRFQRLGPFPFIEKCKGHYSPKVFLF